MFSDLCNRIYQGGSMNGTFRTGDFLFTQPLVWENIHPGDVIVYRGIDQDEIVHRVLSVTEEGLKTRGDNNKFPDPELVKPCSMVGIVVNYERGGKVSKVAGGKHGLCRVFFLRLQKRIWQFIVFLIRYPYQWFRHRHWIEILWRPSLIKIYLETKNGSVVKFLHNKRTVAIWWPENHHFECRKPYDLVIPDPEKSQHT